MISIIRFKRKSLEHHLFVLLMFTLGVIFSTSCKDEYFYDDPGNEPEWLGASIYDYLVEDGNYTNTVKLINDLGFTEVLSKTGSKTLFVANDSAFDVFYQNNVWNVSSYDQLQASQKKMLLKFAMIDNAYLIETLSNYNFGGLNEGLSIRRASSLSQQDTIYDLMASEVPDNYWFDLFYGNKSHYKMVMDHTNKPLVYFLQKPLENNDITDEDFAFITHVSREPGDAHIFDIKVIERDITCKNGYIHKLERVLVPPMNLAEYLLQDPSTSLFSGFLERFAFPYPDREFNEEYNENNLGAADTVFSKYYQSETRLRIFTSEKDAALPFDPGWNSLQVDNALQADMAAIFAPNDQAINNFFSNSAGAELLNVYGSIADIPDDKILPLLDRHMRKSFIQSVPSRFYDMVDRSSYRFPVQPEDIVDTYIGVNGLVYVTNKVYPPIDYASIYAPVLISKATKVFSWAVATNKYEPYINSLENTFTFFVPTDEYFNSYIDPIAYQKEIPAVLKYWYNVKTSSVNATILAYDKSTNTVGDSIDVITDQSFVANRLLDLLDLHLVVDDVNASQEYYFSKGGNVLRVSNDAGSMKVAAGGDVDLGNTASILKSYDQENGTTYYIDKPLQAPTKSVYAVLSSTPEFSAFFALTAGFPDQNIFIKSYEGGSTPGKGDNAADYNVRFFNTFNYTVYVPTNEAIQQALNDSVIHSWDEINYYDTIPELKHIATQYTQELERFLRYHFQDNSVYVGMTDKTGRYQTATIHDADSVTYLGTYKNKYLKLDLNVGTSSLDVSTEGQETVHVVLDNGLYNIMVRDYIFNNSPEYFNQVDGSTAGTDFDDSRIVTSSTAVIHQIDNVLKFE